MISIILVLYLTQTECSLDVSDKIFADLAHTNSNVAMPFQNFATIGFSNNIIGHAVSSQTDPGNLMVYFSKEQNIALYSAYTKTHASQTYEQVEACKIGSDKMMVLFKIIDTQEADNTKHIISALIFDYTSGAIVSEITILEKGQKNDEGDANFANCIEMQSGEVIITFQYKNTQFTLDLEQPAYFKYDTSDNSLSDMKTIGDASDTNAYEYNQPSIMKMNENSFLMVYYQEFSIKAQQINNDLTLKGVETLLYQYTDNQADYRIQLQSMENNKEFIMNMYSKAGLYDTKIFKFNYQFEQLALYETTSLYSYIQYSAFSRNLYVINNGSSFKLHATILKGSEFSVVSDKIEISEEIFFGDNRITITQNAAKDQSYIQVYYPSATTGGVQNYQMRSTKYSLTEFVPVACTDFCKSCNDETGVCTECNDNSNRKINGDGSQCICDDGFEENSGAEVCKLTCNSQCASCDNAITCLTCLDGSAIGEYCYTETPGKYPVIDQVNGNVTYQDCFSRCATCDNGSTCLTCKENDQEGSLCVVQKTGMLTVVGQDGSVSYKKCDAKCRECDGSVGNCSACKIDSNRDINTNCACNQGFEESDQGECEKIKQEIQCGEKQYKEQGICKFCYYLDSDIQEKQCLKGKCPSDYDISRSKHLCIKQDIEKDNSAPHINACIGLLYVILMALL